jgi:NADH-quinone oxidoreductase subunit M
MTDFPILTAILASAAAATALSALAPRSAELAIKVISAVCALAALALSGVLWSIYDPSSAGFQLVEQAEWIPQLGIQYLLGVDGISVLMTALTSLVWFTGVLTMWGLKERVKEYFTLMALLVVGVYGVFLSLDVFAFFFFYEVAVLPMYPLIIVWGSTNREHSAMKLMLYLMGGSALLFPALIGLFQVTGGESWSLIEMAKAPIDADVQIFLYPFLYIGFGVLAGMFPFHGWSPSGHVAAPTAVSMLHAGVLMKLGAYGILRIAMTLLPAGATHWMFPFAALACVNIVYGALVTMRQNDFKFVIGFSSVSHMGIVLLGLNTLGADGINGAVFQMFAHGVMTALFFSAVGFIYDQTHDRDIRHFGGMARQVPVAATYFMLAGLCGIGVPGFASFFAELLVFVGAFQTWPLLGALAIGGLVFTAAFMLRVFGKAMFGPKNPAWSHLVEPTAFERVPRLLLIAVLLTFGFYPRFALDLIVPTTQRLLELF